MISKNLCSACGLTTFVFFLLFSVSLHSQISIQGLISDNEGAAAWDADGSGPEPYGNGHSNFLYYVASRDYVNPSSMAGSHVTTIGSDFPAFELELQDYGFTPGQVTLKIGLASLSDDIEGIDWFTMGNENYLNFYPLNISLYLDGESLITGVANYVVFQMGASTGGEWLVESNFFVPVNASAGSSEAVQAVASAFLQDVDDQELLVELQTIGTSVPFEDNGRSGSYYGYHGSIRKGIPQIPIQGLATNHEGFAGWDADGTGPEPKRNGHSSQLYYIASRDYDGIDPDPDAAFVRMLDDGINGFQNFTLQLAYRGFTPDQVRFKMGLRDIDEDIEGEDWSIVNGIHQVNFYRSGIVADLNGEPLFGYVCDTLKSYYNNQVWWGTTAKSLVYDASGSSSSDVQAVAMSFFKDLGERQIHTEAVEIHDVSGTINTNGRSGGFWEVNEANLIASNGPGTVIPAGNISGNWTMAGHPYIVTSEVTVPNGQTLTIDPGVWVKFTNRIPFNVQGCVNAAGDTSNTGSIVFTAVDPDLGWGHFMYVGTPSTNDTSIFKHCIFEWGYAPGPSTINLPYNCGGALAIRDFNKIVIENCIFQNNRALLGGTWIPSGGAIGLWNSNPVISNSVFRNNTANSGGSIIFYEQSSATIVNCLFYNNKSLIVTSYGGGTMLIWENSNPVLLNNTFHGNQSNFRGGAIDIGNTSHPDLINNIFWNNIAPQGAQISVSSNDCNVDITYNDIEGGEEGIGPFGIGTGVYENNINLDPGFADRLALNFQLSEGTPCIDAGTPDVSGLNLPIGDLLGNWRIWDGNGDGVAIVDMGAYEFGATPVIPGIENPDDANRKLAANSYPNPFISSVLIEYELEENSRITLTISNHLGQNVGILVNEQQAKGTHHVNWSAENLSAGMYYCRLQAGNQVIMKKIVKIQ